MMEGEFKNFIKVCILIFASLSYSYFIASKIPKGKLRLLFLLPIFYYFTILPLDFFSITLRGTTSFLFTWLANFKLLLFSFDQGPLSSSSQANSSFTSFISVTCLPIKIKQNPSPQNKKEASPLTPSSNLAIKILFLALVVYMYVYQNGFIHPKVLLVLYIYSSVEVMVTTCATVARSLLGVELEPQFNKPFLTTSLQDFWGRRWNLMAANILRSTVYVPVYSLSVRIFEKMWAPLLGAFMTFVVSGLMHELIYYHITRVDPTWEVTWFFVIHGICVALELGIKKAIGDRWQLHPWISRPLTIGFVAITGFLWFFPQLLRNDVVLKAMAEYGIFADFVKDNLRLRSFL